MDLMTKLGRLLSELVTAAKAAAFADPQKNQLMWPVGERGCFAPRPLWHVARASVSSVLCQGDLRREGTAWRVAGQSRSPEHLSVVSGSDGQAAAVPNTETGAALCYGRAGRGQHVPTPQPPALTLRT